MHNLIFNIEGSTIGISPKLDFGDPSSKGIIGKINGSPLQRSKPSKREESHTSDTLDEIGIVCVSSGCNKTKSEDSSGDSIKTDVVVQVKTSVDITNNKSSAIGDTPDVPVVVGLAGTNIHEDTSRTFNLNPLESDFVNPYPYEHSPRAPSFFSSTSAPHFSSSFKTPVFNSPQSPSFNPSYDTSSLNSPVNSYDIFTLPNAPSDSVYFENTDANINIKTFPPATLIMTDDRSRDVRYDTNGIKLHNVPYFEPSFNNHYFGEHPPPQLIWYPKKNGILNPVEFRNNPKTTWKPSFGPNRNYNKQTTERTCPCMDQPTIGLKWYPNNNRRSFGDPGSQINDKLAPLN